MNEDINRGDKEMGQSPGNDCSQTIWNWALHEDNLSDSRLMVFLAANSLLMAGATVLIAMDKPPQILVFAVTILGFILSLLWTHIQIQSSILVSEIERKLDAKAKIHKTIFDKLEKKHPFLFKYSRNHLMAWIIPPAFILCWIIFSAYEYFRYLGK